MNLSWSDALLACLFWGLTIYLFSRAPSREQWTDRRVVAPRLLVLLLAISLSFQVDPLAARFDALVGVNNLSWFLAYANVSVAAYAGVLAMVVMARRTVPLWLNGVTAIMFLALVLLFPSVAQSPEELHNQLPASAALLTYRELLYVYLSFMAIVGIRIHRLWLKQEESATGKLRGAILLLSLTSGVVFFWSRGLASLFVYFNPGTALYQPLLSISNVLAAIAIAGLAAAFAPPVFMQFPIRVFMYLEQQLTLRDLVRLRDRMSSVTGTLPWPQPTRRERWFNTSFALYCTVIEILDHENLLRAKIISNDPKVSELHRRVARDLQELANTTDWVELLPSIRQVARKY